MVKSVTKIGRRHRHIKKNKSVKNKSIKRKNGNVKKDNVFKIAADPSTLRILSKAKKEYNEMTKSVNHPVLNRLFRESTIDKLKKLPNGLTNIATYSKVLKKEFVKLKNNKKNQPNQDFYNYVNEEWNKSQKEE